MFSQPESNGQTSSQSAWQSAPPPNRRLERYLEEISRPLADPQRSEWREEVRQHLDAMVAAHEELGSTHDEAVEAALASFGNPATIGERVTRETAASTADPALQGMLRFLLTVVPGFLILGAVAALYVVYGGDGYLAGTGRLASVFLVALPLLGGWGIGRKASPNQVRRDLLLVPMLGALASLPMALVFSCLSHPFVGRPRAADLALWFSYALLSTWVSFLVCPKPQVNRAAY